MNVKPISKQDAINRSTEEVDKIVEKLMVSINKRLMNFVDGSSISVDVSRTFDDLNSEIRNKVRQQIIKEYSALGWKVDFSYGDQREPDCSFVFS